MLYVFFGTDTVQVREKAFALLSDFENRGATIERITPEQYQKGMLVNYAGATSLFHEEQVILIDTPSEVAATCEDVFDHLGTLSESKNTFVIIEGKLLADQKRKVVKFATEQTEITAASKERFNTFRLTDAFLRRDKKSLWLLFTQAMHAGIVLEEIAGVLFWQLKTLRLVAKTKNAKDSGLKDFAYKKAHNALNKFSITELDTLSQELVSIYHDGHRGKRDLDYALERWILTL